MYPEGVASRGSASRRCNPFGAGLPRCPVVLLNCCLTGSTDILLRGDTDVTLSLSAVHREEPRLRHGPGGPGESVPARAARRTVRTDSSNAVSTNLGVLVGR